MLFGFSWFKKLTCFIQLCSKVDEYGFERPDDFDYKAYETFMTQYMGVLTRRAMRWNTILDVNNMRDSATVKRFVRKGIPAQHRARVYHFLLIHYNM